MPNREQPVEEAKNNIYVQIMNAIRRGGLNWGKIFATEQGEDVEIVFDKKLCLRVYVTDDTMIQFTSEGLPELVM